MAVETLKFLPWIPLLGAVLCAICCTSPALRRLAGAICVLSVASALALALGVYFGPQSQAALSGTTVHALRWIDVHSFSAGFSYYIDGLTMIMLFVVTGIGALIALYATGYMKGDRGYARFFFGVCLFIFAMTTLVMADSLVLLYLGWEGVGLCSYLLIGYYYDKPFAVEAAKKAFIVNRIGDLGFALGIFLTWTTFDTVSLHEAIEKARHILEHGGEITTAMQCIPFLLMAGAFGKSAQFPLYVWLPDAMAGPTPVSALIHAATMVTSGVFMIARLIPIFELSTYALPVVAIIGTFTALLAATIALTNNDLKGVFAYSTVSQLGYMFLGVGVLSTTGGIFHLFTHAFFKALLFLTAGSVMHALAGQLDIRTMGGLRKRMPVTCWLMFAGCLALAGVPPFSGFVSKDMILHDALARGLHGEPLFFVLAIAGLFTALLTAYYTFRLWFRVFMGPERFEMGEEHGHDEHAAHDEHASGGHGPHEMPWWPMNLPLVVLAIGAIAAGILAEYVGGEHGWMHTMIEHSTASVEHEFHGELFGLSLHSVMVVLSLLIAALGIGTAAYLHWLRRDAAGVLEQKFAPLVKLLVNKYYVDELYDLAIVRPLRGCGKFFNLIDDYLIQGFLVQIVGGWGPRLVGYVLKPSQSGRLQSYGVGMAVGVVIVMVILIFKLTGN
ncbi:MAG: NADH-quinone oxidoreductase subunit L [Phycisphaeraceae bacterium]|nr:NADH-quinone oxidoreductase subunit L [Phycisphaeraceae bacterium]